jgi:hypothetical protein
LARERHVDPAAHLQFVLRVSGEKNVEVETVLDSFGANVVRSKGTGWFVLPVPAQGHRDRSPGGPLVGFIAQGEDRFVHKASTHGSVWHRS